MTTRATIFLLSTILASGPVLAQTAPPPAADETPAITAPEASEDAEPASSFTPVDIDDPEVPEPIASRAVPPDYTQTDSEAMAGTESAVTSPDEPQPTPEVEGVATEPEQGRMSPEAAEALDTSSDEASADNPAPAPQQSTENAEDDGVASAATPPDPAAPDGTSPDSAGSSGWTGGLGGSMIGTNPAGAVPESTTWQPPTSRGLDLQG